METIKARCNNVTQADGRGVANFVVEDKQKKAQQVITIQFPNPGDAAKYVHNKLYSFDIKEAK